MGKGRNEMTLREAIAKGICRVYDTKWASKNAYIKIHMVDGKHGPWFYFFDREYQELLNFTTPQPILFTQLNMDGEGLEPYVGKLDKDDHLT